jgi:hypothetical protein
MSPSVGNAPHLQGAVSFFVVRPKRRCWPAVLVHGSAWMRRHFVAAFGALSVGGTNEAQRSGASGAARLRQSFHLHASVNPHLSPEVSATRAPSVASLSKAIASGATPAAVASSTTANWAVKRTHNGGARLRAPSALAAAVVCRLPQR